MYNFWCPYPTYAIYQSLVKIGPVFLDKKMSMNNDGRQPIAIGHLSDSRDLKMGIQYYVFLQNTGYLSRRLKWAILIEMCPLSTVVVVVLNFEYFRLLYRTIGPISNKLVVVWPFVCLFVKLSHFNLLNERMSEL